MFNERVIHEHAPGGPQRFRPADAAVIRESPAAPDLPEFDALAGTRAGTLGHRLDGGGLRAVRNVQGPDGTTEPAQRLRRREHATG